MGVIVSVLVFTPDMPSGSTVDEIEQSLIQDITKDNPNAVGYFDTVSLIVRGISTNGPEQASQLNLADHLQKISTSTSSNRDDLFSFDMISPNDVEILDRCDTIKAMKSTPLDPFFKAITQPKACFSKQLASCCLAGIKRWEFCLENHASNQGKLLYIILQSIFVFNIHLFVFFLL